MGKGACSDVFMSACVLVRAYMGERSLVYECMHR